MLMAASVVARPLHRDCQDAEIFDATQPLCAREVDKAEKSDGKYSAEQVEEILL
jgi:hypothetical protein